MNTLVEINNLNEAKTERLKELQGAVTRDDILKDLRETQKALQRLEGRLAQTASAGWKSKPD